MTAETLTKTGSRPGTFSGWTEQHARNESLLASTRYLGERVTSDVLAFALDVKRAEGLSEDEVLLLKAIETEAARVAIRALASLAEINELDHLGGGLDLIPAFTLTLAVTDNEAKRYTFEHAHTSIGYYSTLAVYGYLDAEYVVTTFRRGLTMSGHSAWVPGGTELNGGRLGVMIPAAVGQALGLRAHRQGEGWVVCHCGDAGWISGQALNGFNGADWHGAPITFVMHRNGIQLSGTNRQIMDKDPRPIIASLGIEILEIPTLLDPIRLFDAYRESYKLAASGRPALIYPVGYRSHNGEKVTLTTFGERYGILDEVQAFATRHDVDLQTEVWIPGSLMSYRDVVPMLECLFHVNQLPGGAGHHDGHMKGRNLNEVLANPMFQEPEAQRNAWTAARSADKRQVTTTARPAPGSRNLPLERERLEAVELPPVGKRVSARAGVAEGYAAVAAAYPDRMFVFSCDLDTSTKLDKARTFLPDNHQFEMSIEEQASALMANGLSVSTHEPQLVVFSTFAAFFEGIAREGFEMWRYQRNLTGRIEGLNVTFHLSHVGACTGRDHFSGWGLDWINLALGYLPYLHRFYAPADARAAFVAVRDLAAHYGGHIVGVPRDALPILSGQDGAAPLWDATSDWEAVTTARTYPGARHALLPLGAPAFLAVEAAETLNEAGTPVDVLIVNGLPLPEGMLASLFDRYAGGLVTIEDGLIATPETGLRGWAGVVRSAGSGSGIPLDHIGIVDPRVAPSEGHMETWAHFGITKEAIVKAVGRLAGGGNG